MHGKAGLEGLIDAFELRLSLPVRVLESSSTSRTVYSQMVQDVDTLLPLQ
jgi:hypothetical protein